ncbi:MAG: hypothetical protein M9950_07390 [Thermomicrobiales bacterium]|nr:hypothetical protein [Thermomicrobiales bacterium]
MSHVELLAGNPTEALTLLLEATYWYERCEDSFILVQCLDNLGDVALALGEPERAAWLVGAADSVAHNHGIVREELMRGEHEQIGGITTAAPWTGAVAGFSMIAAMP